MASSIGDARPVGRALSTELLLARFRGTTTLSPGEIELILSLGEQPRSHAAGSTICPHEDGSPHPRLMVSGWACRPRIMADGRRQMLGLLVPGDMMGDRADRRPLALNPVIALTPVRTIGIGRLIAARHEQPDRYPAIARALLHFDQVEEAALLDHVVRLGCQSALQRMAHLLLELHRRMAAIGFVHDGAYPMPVTQDTLGEFLGLSLVHVNRIVAQLRRTRLATMRAGLVTIHDFGRLALLGDHRDPTQGDPVV